jgi:hypothetical protein
MILNSNGILELVVQAHRMAPGLSPKHTLLLSSLLTTQVLQNRGTRELLAGQLTTQLPLLRWTAKPDNLGNQKLDNLGNETHR